VLHPLVLWSGSWAFSSVLFALRLLPYRNLSWLTTGLICGSILVFAVGAALGTRLGSRRFAGIVKEQAGAVELGAVLAVGLLVVTLGVFLGQLISRYGITRVLQISPEVKLYLSGGEAPFASTYVDVAMAAATVSALAAGFTRVRTRRALWLLVAAACAGSVYFSTSRAFIVVALIAAGAAFLVSKPSISSRVLAIGATTTVIVTLAIFIGLGSVLGKTYGSSTIGEFDNFFSEHPSVSALALPYEDATASIPALDVLTRVSPTWGYAHGCATVPVACGVVRKLGVHAVRVPVAGPFTKAPLRWNGYTFLERFMIDGGTALTLVLVAITGALAGFWWARARAGSATGIVVYAISVPALLAAYRQNLIEIVLIASIIAACLLLAGRLLSGFTASLPRRAASHPA
jgi:hypothetical protein